MSESEGHGAQGEGSSTQPEPPRMRILMPDNCPACFGDRIFVSLSGDRGDVSFSFYQYIPDFGESAAPVALRCQAVAQTPPVAAAQLSIWALSLVLEGVSADALRDQFEDMKKVAAQLLKKVEDLDVRKTD